MLENKCNAFYQTLKEGFDKADEQAKEIKRNIVIELNENRGVYGTCKN